MTAREYNEEVYEGVRPHIDDEVWDMIVEAAVNKDPTEIRELLALLFSGY